MLTWSTGRKTLKWLTSTGAQADRNDATLFREHDGSFLIKIRNGGSGHSGAKTGEIGLLDGIAAFGGGQGGQGANNRRHAGLEWGEIVHGAARAVHIHRHRHEQHNHYQAPHGAECVSLMLQKLSGNQSPDIIYGKLSFIHGIVKGCAVSHETCELCDNLTVTEKTADRRHT